MSASAREALRLLTAALETHLEAVESRRSATDATVDDAYEAVAESFERYEEVLDVEYAEALPLILDDEVADALDEDTDDDEDEDDLDADDDRRQDSTPTPWRTRTTWTTTSRRSTSGSRRG